MYGMTITKPKQESVIRNLEAGKEEITHHHYILINDYGTKFNLVESMTKEIVISGTLEEVKKAAEILHPGDWIESNEIEAEEILKMIDEKEKEFDSLVEEKVLDMFLMEIIQDS